MNFESRIKKEMSEGIIRALLEDAGYRVIDCGIESVLRELVCLTADAYNQLEYPRAMADLPDFTVMNFDQTEKHLVEVKYRRDWNKNLFLEVGQQVETFGLITLVSVNAQPPESNRGMDASPSRFLRSCRLRFSSGILAVELAETREGPSRWLPVDQIPDREDLWWRMKLLQDQFPLINERKNEQTLTVAVQALTGILNI
jgi:hypothetical protein